MHHTILIAAVAAINGASFVGIDTRTEVKLTGGRKNPQQGRVTKRTIGATVMAFTNQNINAYKAMVERRLVAEGKAPTDFVISERAWGTRLPNMPIVVHNKNGVDHYYLEVIFLKPGTVSYFQDGAPIAKSDIIGMVESGGDEQGGLENKVVIRSFKADSITEVRIDGKAFN